MSTSIEEEEAMARKGRVDRGLLEKLNAEGKKVWFVRLHHDGNERRFGSFNTKTAARDFYNKAKLEQKTGRFFPERYQHGGYVLTENLIQHHLERPTVKNVSAFKNYGRWWMAGLKGKRLNMITPSVLEEAQHDLLATGLAPQTVRHYMQFLRHLLNKAKRDGKLDRNPFDQITLPKVGHGKTRFLNDDEETRLLDKLGPIYGPWARLAILTGLRLSEQFSMKWADVDFDRGLITLPKTKAGDVQYAVLNDEAKSILRELQIRQMNQGALGVWVFPSDNQRTHIDQRNFYSRVFVPAVEALNLDEGVTWHTLRHTFASRLAMSGQGEGTIAALLRHSTNALVRRYAHLSPSHLKAAAEQVANFGKPIGTVTKTVTGEKSEGEKNAQVFDKFGAGDGI
jgi:integrase